ncbi:FMN-binding protein, partial [Myxococcota bacterium]|nr:FMN-binding protein [Myxococcota bacterium]
MAKPGKTLRRIKMVLFMALLSIVFVTAVSAVHLATRKMIARNDSIFTKRSILYTAGIPVPGSQQELDNVFKAHVRLIPRDKLQLYEVKFNGRLSWVITASGSGLWGEIRAHVGIGSDFLTITGVNFIEQNETPGLGARISELWFREQFRGKKGPLRRVPEGTKSKKPRVFDAIT